MIDVTFDLETENLNLALCRPWQLAYIVADGGRIKKEINRYIDIPDLKMSVDAARITRFSWETYHDRKVPINDVIDEFESYIFSEDKDEEEKIRMIGHNTLGYDIYVLKNLYKLAGRKLDFKKIVYRFYDTLAIARAQHFESRPPKGKFERLEWQYKYLHKYDRAVKTSLSAVAGRNDIEVDPTKTHDALYDVQLNYKVFKKLEYAMELAD